MEAYRVVSECVSDKVMSSMAGQDFFLLEVAQFLLSGWTGALMATAAISLIPNLLLFFLPSSAFTGQKKGKSWNLSNILLCFAVAGLLGDVFLHILPHMLGGHDHAHGHGHDDHGHHEEHQHDHRDHHDEHHHEHEGAHHHDNVCKEASCGFSAQVHKTIYEMIGLERSICIQLMVLFGFLVFFTAEKIAKARLGGGHVCAAHKKDDDREEETSNKDNLSWQDKLTTSGWLNLLADMMHNFTDGIAIGASFAGGKGLALATFISVILHEIPHEIGDFTILVNSGLSKYEAIRAQFITALGAFAGTFVGLLAQRNPIFEDLFLAFTSGGFIYIATVGAMPQIIAEQSSMGQIVAEIVAFVLGVLMMVAVTFFE